MNYFALDPSKKDLNEVLVLLREQSNEIISLKEMLAKQNVILEKMSSKIFSMNTKIDIFPIKTIAEIKSLDATVENFPEYELVSLS